MLLADLRGQEQATSLLMRAVAAARVAHAYLFDGPSGVGKSTAALGLALSLVCPDAPGKGCGRCDVCRRVLAGNHPDVRLVAPTTTRILLEQAKEIVRLASQSPHEAPARIIVIDDADRLTEQAANCLLKTLEEPFRSTHLVLVTAAADRLLPTIRSRTQRVRFVALSPVTLIEIAIGRGADRRRAETAAALAGGSVTRLGELLETSVDGGLWTQVKVLRDAAAHETMGAILDAAATFGDKESKEGLPDVLALLARFYRDALASALGAPEQVLLKGAETTLRQLASATAGDPRRTSLRRALAAVTEAEVSLGGNANALLVVERLLLELRPCERAKLAGAEVT